MTPHSNPRLACLSALQRWEHGSLFADEILHDILRRGDFAILDRAFLTETFYGIIRNLSLLDFWISLLRDEPLDSDARNLVRLGLYQIFQMRVAHHAAVNETVQLAGRARGLVNALLRRSIRESDRLRAESGRAPESIRLSHPDHLVARWQKAFGTQNATRLCEWNNEPAEVFARANTLKVTAGELLRSNPEAVRLAKQPLILQVKHPPISWLIAGLCYVQDPSTLLSCELLDPQPGERVLDACAAPGGKTSYLAQLMHNEGELIACDASNARLARLRDNLARLGVMNARSEQVNWLAGSDPFFPESFDRILMDAPCSNTGVIRRRIDVRWRLSPDDFQRMPETQLALMKSVAPLLKKGGTLVYSTCSLEAEENELLVERVEKEIPHFSCISSLRSLPFRDGTDGAFAAKFIRR